jgi:hypothetical protein
MHSDPTGRRILKIPASEQAAKAAARELRARDAELAMKEYQAERLAIQANTARLRALRLAKEPGAVASSKSVRRTRRAS